MKEPVESRRSSLLPGRDVCSRNKPAVGGPHRSQQPRTLERGSSKGRAVMATLPSTALAWLRSLCWHQPPETQAMPGPWDLLLPFKGNRYLSEQSLAGSPTGNLFRPISTLPFLPFCLLSSFLCAGKATPARGQHFPNCGSAEITALSKSHIPGSWGTATGMIPQPSEASGSSPVLWHFSCYYQGKGLALQ